MKKTYFWNVLVGGLSVLFFGVLLSTGCKKDSSEDTGGVCIPEMHFEVDGELAPNARNPIEVVDSWLIYTCDDFPANPLGLGAICGTHEECAGADEICVKGMLPCDGPDVGRCTKTCRMDYECTNDVIADDVMPELICAMPQDQLSVCMPSACLAEVPGWDTICGPLKGESVNDNGIGMGCNSDDDCPSGTFCPGDASAERYCTKMCEVDSDCGEGAACVCVEDETCTEFFFVCAPTENCADAVRHHHCRGAGIAPREHGAICGNHDH